MKHRAKLLRIVWKPPIPPEIHGSSTEDRANTPCCCFFSFFSGAFIYCLVCSAFLGFHQNGGVEGWGVCRTRNLSSYLVAENLVMGCPFSLGGLWKARDPWSDPCRDSVWQAYTTKLSRTKSTVRYWHYDCNHDHLKTKQSTFVSKKVLLSYLLSIV